MQDISPTLVVLPNNTLVGIESKTFFTAENYTIGNLFHPSIPPNSLHIRQNVDLSKDLIHFPVDFPPENLLGLSLINRRDPMISLSTADVSGIFDRFPNLIVFQLDGFEINHSIVELLISKNLKTLALIRVDGIELQPLVCSNIIMILIEEENYVHDDNFDIESYRKLIRD
ncbi:hypothetical protein [Anditalea andensis]|uniref:Uncharacterized protein n=1 Tax=Anditalea andensis TaxID=1048983 RepID=A0A074KYA6_9BACT|nr:hypothetical protein [Anditalea andensis]KEO73939.1 hypothetical protein EL17_09435 [Anditalea andensis]